MTVKFCLASWPKNSSGGLFNTVSALRRAGVALSVRVALQLRFSFWLSGSYQNDEAGPPPQAESCPTGLHANSRSPGEPFYVLWAGCEVCGLIAPIHALTIPTELHGHSTPRDVDRNILQQIDEQRGPRAWIHSATGGRCFVRVGGRGWRCSP